MAPTSSSSITVIWMVMAAVLLLLLVVLTPPRTVVKLGGSRCSCQLMVGRLITGIISSSSNSSSTGSIDHFGGSSSSTITISSNSWMTMRWVLRHGRPWPTYDRWEQEQQEQQEDQVLLLLERGDIFHFLSSMSQRCCWCHPVDVVGQLLLLSCLSCL